MVKTEQIEENMFCANFIIANKEGIELGFVDIEKNIDIDIGGTNDFLINLNADGWSKEMYDFGYRIYAPNTEYGGLLEDKRTSTKENTVSYMGYTWRGLLAKKIIEPKTGDTHLRVAGDANEVIREVLGNRFGDLFVVENKNSGIIVNYQFERYINLLDGLTKMLNTQNARLKIQYVQGEGTEPGAVHISAVAIVDWSNELEYSQDNRVNFSTRDYKMGINHLICAGEGVGTNREVLHLYMDLDGNIGDKQYYFGKEERASVYSYTSQENAEKLREDGSKRLKELANYKQFEISLDNIDVELGDVVGGCDRITGMRLKKPVANKVLKITQGKTTIDYKLKGDN